jgi:hypothetical protein
MIRRAHPLDRIALKEVALRSDDGLRSSRNLRDWTTALAREPEPPALVQNEPSCYHVRVLDPRVSATLSATTSVAMIGHCYHI